MLVPRGHAKLDRQRMSAQVYRAHVQKALPSLSDVGQRGTLPSDAPRSPERKMSDEPSCVEHCTRQWQSRLFEGIRAMSMKDKRQVFFALRQAPNEDAFLPKHGLFVGEFALFHLLGEKGRRSQKDLTEEALGKEGADALEEP